MRKIISYTFGTFDKKTYFCKHKSDTYIALVNN